MEQNTNKEKVLKVKKKLKPHKNIMLSSEQIKKLYLLNHIPTNLKKEHVDHNVSKNQIIWGGNYFSLPASRCMICWDKKQKMPSLSSWELGWTSFDKPSKIFSCVSTDLDRIHPTQKPVSLYKWLLKNYAHTGDKLFDTHSGSGSFRIAAYDMGFDLVSCEIDADYCKANEARFQAHIAQQELIPTSEIQQLTFGGDK